MSFNRDLDRWHMRLATLEVTSLAHPADAPRTWATQTDFPYLDALTREQATAFVRDLRDGVIRATRCRSLEPVESTVRAWQRAASDRRRPAC